LWKFGIPFNTETEKRDELLAQWIEAFQHRTGFVVHKSEIKGKPAFVYLTIHNVTLDQADGLETRLGSLKLKDLRVGGETGLPQTAFCDGANTLLVNTPSEAGSASVGGASELTPKRLLPLSRADGEPAGGKGQAKAARSQ
jgi:hypothetical protein